MKEAVAGMKPRSFEAPRENVVFVEIDKETGLLATPFCPKTMTEAFIAGTEPRETCYAH
jgi:membrane carboxypeptidase/penicillin-binding protein